ncbi:MAG: cytochrome c, partial [Rhodospirillaceae bacterium]
MVEQKYTRKTVPNLIVHLPAVVLLLLGFITVLPAAAAEPHSIPPADSASLFASHCASCHGTDHLGGRGPALLPDSLIRLRADELTTVITHGRNGTGMVGFADQLAPAEISGLADW